MIAWRQWLSEGALAGLYFTRSYTREAANVRLDCAAARRSSAIAGLPAIGRLRSEVSVCGRVAGLKVARGRAGKTKSQ